MHRWHRAGFALVTLTVLAATAAAEPPEQPPAEEARKKEPRAGDFDAGGQVRLPSGPDELGEFATFNWVALDLQARYYLLPSVFIRGDVPVAIIAPDTLMTADGGTIEPSMIGGIELGLEARLPRMDSLPLAARYKDSEVGVILDGAVMREGAMALSEKDYPLFTGKFQPGFAAGILLRIKLSTLIDLQSRPVVFYQLGSDDPTNGMQIPVSTILAIGSLIKVSADLGINSGDDWAFRGKNGGRLALGGALDVKLGKIIVHAGAGTANLLGGPIYPSFRDAFYLDLNVKYAR